jgi:LAO/AO transport system kinase
LDLIADLKKGKRGAIAKAISIVENDQTESKKLLKKIFKSSGILLLLELLALLDLVKVL